MANGMLTISLQAHWQIEARGSDGEGQCRARVCLRTCLCESISERGQGSAEPLNAIKRYYYRGIYAS